MSIAFVNGGLAILAGYWEQHGEEVEGGARVELRRVHEVASARTVPGTAGFTVEPLSSGGLWRADLFVVLTDGGRPCFHHHPRFEDDDVGQRAFEDRLTADPRAWIADRLADLPGLLEASGAQDLLASIDLEEHARNLSVMLTVIDAALGRATLALSGYR